jgi:gluconokinase
MKGLHPVMILGTCVQASSTKVVVFTIVSNINNLVLTARGRAEPSEILDVSDRFRGLAPFAMIIMGVSGSGKSTLGAALADAIGCPFLEGDAFHTPGAIAKMGAGEPLTDEDRWPWLDRIAQAINDATTTRGVTIAACSALKRSYRDRLRAGIHAPARFVLLDAERNELQRRLSNRPGHYMPASLLTSQLDTLERPDPDEQVLTLDARLPLLILRGQVTSWLSAGPASR